MERGVLKLNTGASKMGTDADAINPRLRRAITNKWSQRSKKVFFIRKPIITMMLHEIVFFVYGSPQDARVTALTYRDLKSQCQQVKKGERY
jgi:hypothetical protein